MCNEARRNIWQANPSAVFEIDGCLHKKTNKKSIINRDIIIPRSSSSSNQESVNMTKVFFENFPSGSFDYITKSNNILENILVQNMDEASQEASF
jgi:hypothetical protein